MSKKQKRAQTEGPQDQPATDTSTFNAGLLQGLVLGSPLSHDGLTIIPLNWSQPHDPPYVLLSQAITAGQAVVEEVSESGSVPQLLVTSKCDRPILIPEGEILIGAKQNRVINITVLVKPGSKFRVPVSCVEAGRWHYNTRHFVTRACAPPSLRAKKARSVQRNRAERGVAESDQQEVWNEVAACLESVSAASPTSSLTDGLAATDKRLAQYREAFNLRPDAAGVLVAEGQRVVGLDLYDSPQTLQSVWGRLRDAYVFEALRKEQAAGQLPPDMAMAFLNNVAAHQRRRPSAADLGEEFEIAGETIVGGALCYEGKLCHLSAFATSTY